MSIICIASLSLQFISEVSCAPALVLEEKQKRKLQTAQAAMPFAGIGAVHRLHG
jgi:hypothetical protein